MNRNTEQRFKEIPSVQIERSTFKLPQNIKTTGNAGDLIPFFLEQDVLPGDTFKINMNIVARMQTPIYPVMDNAFIDTYFFFIPNRLLWSNWNRFMGENETGAWTQSVEYEIPQINFVGNKNQKGSILDYMGLPIEVTGMPSVSALPIRAYVKTYNDWFRDENLIAPLTLDKSDTTITYDNSSTIKGGKPAKIAKFHDYFTSCLPGVQKGTAQLLPLGASAQVYGDGKALVLSDGSAFHGGSLAQDQTSIMSINTITGNKNLGAIGTPIADIPDNSAVGVPNKTLLETMGLTSTGLITDLSTIGATINALRLNIQTQRILEKDARGGTRYIELIKNHFGVTSEDARQQRSEYLGGKRIPINMQEIPQTSSTDATSPQGNLSAYSHTVDTNNRITKSFTEHGIILGLMAMRTQKSYQQGINRSWSRKKRLDLYWPTLAHLGEQAVLNKEIYTDASATDEQVFGYQERWAEYRYKPNIITGELRSTYATPLDAWHYGDKYTTLPTLSQAFIEETNLFVKRTLAIQTKDQFIADILVDIEATRPIPMYSIPGLMDHF